MRKLGFADSSGSFHRSTFKTQGFSSAIPSISKTCFDGKVRAYVGGFVLYMKLTIKKWQPFDRVTVFRLVFLEAVLVTLGRPCHQRSWKNGKQEGSMEKRQGQTSLSPRTNGWLGLFSQSTGIVILCPELGFGCKYWTWSWGKHQSALGCEKRKCYSEH